MAQCKFLHKLILMKLMEMYLRTLNLCDYNEQKVYKKLFLLWRPSDVLTGRR